MKVLVGILPVLACVAWGIVINGVVAAATLAIAVFSVVQALAAKANASAAKTSAESLIKAERAWLTVKVGNVFTAEYQMRYVGIPVKNNGRTPAKVVKMVATSKLIPFPENSWAKPGELPGVWTTGDTNHTMATSERDFVIPPGGEHIIYGTIFSSEWQSIQARKVSLYVYGYVEYLDTVEGREHKTCFCEIYWVPEPNTGGIEEFRFLADLIPPAYICAT